MSKIKRPVTPINIENFKYKLTKVEDDFGAKFANKIGYIEWKENDHFKKIHDSPAVGLSLILDPHRLSYTWLTTTITEIIKDTKDLVEFKTLNSHYKLEKIKDENRD
jgi:hypothetical protein